MCPLHYTQKSAKKSIKIGSEIHAERHFNHLGKLYESPIISAVNGA